MDTRNAVDAWRKFAASTELTWNGDRRTWKEHIRSSYNYADEEEVIQPRVFPEFAEGLLGYEVGLNLAPERKGREGKPDFTPADAVTHPFVFETKSTRDGTDISGYESQIRRYLTEGRPRIQRVVLTNLVGIRVISLDASESLQDEYSVNLLALLDGSLSTVVGLSDAENLRRVLDEFRYRELSSKEKLKQVRQQPDWNPLVEVTDGQWISTRLDRVVQVLTDDVTRQVDDGALTDSSLVLPEEQSNIEDELQELEWRLGTDYDEAEERSLEEYTQAHGLSTRATALKQYNSHVAYYTATRLLLVRIWEDLGLLDPVLYDGGFDEWMDRFDDVVERVVSHSFNMAKDHYRSLFEGRTNYDWYVPSHEAYADAIYELANTYLGEIASDILGEVYEELLERVDRKLLGQYYTPRDIIELIWDLVDSDVTEAVGNGQNHARVLDIATGSGGFLVEAANRIRRGAEEKIEKGASIDRQQWVESLSAELSGIEIQRFPAYLAELNLLIQLGHVLSKDRSIRLPPLGIVNTDSLSLHNPVELFDDETDDVGGGLIRSTKESRERAKKIKDPFENDYLMDVACGNPPYVGEKRAASLLRRTKDRYPYWKKYAGHHMDYLYWFVVFGVSKLRKGGKFGFITTEYWLRAIGAKALRKYLARRCSIERILLFRDFRLFPDAPGQHSMVITGERKVEPDHRYEPDRDDPGTHYPRVSVYRSEQPRSERVREAIIATFRQGKSNRGVESFEAPRSPNELEEESWAEVVLTNEQVTRREAMRSGNVLDIDPDEGIVTGASSMRTSYEQHLTKGTLDSLEWPDSSTGIFCLSETEVEALGDLTPKEKEALRPALNTKDLFPYAAVPPEEGEYLLRMSGDLSNTPKEQKSLHSSFPDDMPAIERHLSRFRSLLEYKVRNYGEEDRRPWWTVHRPKEYVVERDSPGGQWADYCVTTRWGAGENLTVGLAPSGSAPKSGIYALLCKEDVPASYASGVLNATAVQELAETLPPGVIRSQDLEEIGVPHIEDKEDEIANHALVLADVVWDLVRAYGEIFPLLPERLQEDVSLSSLPTDSWCPSVGSSANWGPLKGVQWIDEIKQEGAQAKRIDNVRVERDLFGLGVEIVSSTGSKCTVVLSDTREVLAKTLAKYCRGIGQYKKELRDVSAIEVPVEPDGLIDRYTKNVEDIRGLQESYHSRREAIDEIVDAVV